jgi:hypothetical protein
MITVGHGPAHVKARDTDPSANVAEVLGSDMYVNPVYTDPTWEQ